ncbi:hypothetical protein Trydic_g1575 [Trypoxylus dichotomus]
MLKLQIVILLLCSACELVQSKLLVVHLLFRHGEKTPDNFMMLPEDPYRNDFFHPYGPSALTNEGKRTMYNLGKTFRKRYDKFLGDIYTPHILDAWTSSFERCHTSLQLVLASIFPPKDLLIWDEAVHWQPIAYKSLLRKDDTMFLGALRRDFEEIYKAYYLKGEGKVITEEIQPILSYVRMHTNATMETLRNLITIQIVWSAEDEYGLVLPEWSKKIYPQPLNDLVLKDFQLEMATKELARKAVGQLVRKILKDSENYLNDKSNYKLHLYSAHDFTIACVMIFFNMTYASHAGYGASLAIELHEENGTYFFEVNLVFPVALLYIDISP